MATMITWPSRYHTSVVETIRIPWTRLHYLSAARTTNCPKIWSCTSISRSVVSLTSSSSHHPPIQWTLQSNGLAATPQLRSSRRNWHLPRFRLWPPTKPVAVMPLNRSVDTSVPVKQFPEWVSIGLIAATTPNSHRIHQSQLTTDSCQWTKALAHKLESSGRDQMQLLTEQLADWKWPTMWSTKVRKVSPPSLRIDACYAL